MTVVAEVRLPANALPPGDHLSAPPSVEIDMVEVVPTDSSPLPYFWLRGDDSAFEQALRDDERTDHVRVVDRFDGSALYHTRWADDLRFPLQACLDEDLSVERATGSADGWTLRLRFVDHESMAAFRERCRDTDLTVEVDRIYHPGPPEKRVDAALTQPQREALVLAREEGYFDDPRGTTLAELGEELGISRQAVSYRIRRGTRHLVDSMVVES
jgi:predicted DNA binding protein